MIFCLLCEENNDFFSPFLVLPQRVLCDIIIILSIDTHLNWIPHHQYLTYSIRSKLYDVLTFLGM